MYLKLTIPIIGLCLPFCNLFPQNGKTEILAMETTLAGQKVSSAFDLKSSSTNTPVDVNNLLNSSLFSIFPDSVYFIGNDSGKLLSKIYFTKSNNTVKVKSDFGWNIKNDVYYYSEKGLLDSAIVETEADAEYDEYSLKHVFSYNDGLKECNKVFVDNTNDSVDNNWVLSRTENFVYENGRIKQDIIQGIQKTAYFYSNSSSSYTRIDTVYSSRSDSSWFREAVYINNFVNNQLILSKYYTYSGFDSVGSLDYLNKMEITYDENGNLFTVTTTMTADFAEAWPSSVQDVYVYNQNGTIDQKTTYEKFDNSWYFTYQYQYFYPVSNSAITNINDSKIVEFSIYPNPVNDLLNFKGAGNVSKVKIYTVEGRIVSNQFCFNNAVSVSYLAKGTYIIEITLQDNSTLKRIFIKK